MNDRLRVSGLVKGVLLRMYNVYMIRKGEVLNLRVMGGTRRHWKRITLHLASARKLDEWLEQGLSRLTK